MIERTGIITLTYGESTATVTVIQAGEVELEEVAITAPYLLGDYSIVDYRAQSGGKN